VQWENIEEGMDSMPDERSAPLHDWSAFSAFRLPDPEKRDDLLGNPVDWNARAAHLRRVKEQGGLASGGLSHGFMFMRLFYLRGYSNFMLDVATHDPRLDALAALVCDFNVRLVRLWLDAGIEMLHAGDDLGTQTALPISPADWRRILKPCYQAIFGPCRQQGVFVYLHSDGHILEIIPDLVECGVNVINPQVRANTLEGLRRVARGRVCINLDLDRQLFPFATPEEIRDHIREAHETLNTPEGGLMLHAECEPDVPPRNVRAICEALEEVCGLR
jgi:uroporphyrinogen-III decarboxylase